MSLKDLKAASENDKAKAEQDESLMFDTVGLSANEIAQQQSQGVTEVTGGQQNHDHGNVVDMQGHPLSTSFAEKLAAMGPDREPTKKMVRYVSSLSRRLNLTTPEGYENSFNACRLFLDENAYVIGQYKKQRKAAQQAGHGQPGNDQTVNQVTMPPDLEGAPGGRLGGTQASQQPSSPIGPVSGVGAAIGAIAGLGAGIWGLGAGLVKFPKYAGVKGLHAFRKANMENAIEDAHTAAGQFTETVDKLMGGHATQEDVRNAYNAFQSHYKAALHNINKVGVKTLEEEPEKLDEVRHKIAAIKENAEVNGIGKLEQDTRFKELGEQLSKAFENVIKFFENIFNRLFGRQPSAGPSI